MALEFKVLYEDGGEGIIKVKPRHLLRVEKAKHNNPTVEDSYYLAWVASETDVPYQDWVDSLDELTSVNDDVEPADDGSDIPPTTPGSRP